MTVEPLQLRESPSGAPITLAPGGSLVSGVVHKGGNNFHDAAGADELNIISDGAGGATWSYLGSAEFSLQAVDGAVLQYNGAGGDFVVTAHIGLGTNPGGGAIIFPQMAIAHNGDVLSPAAGDRNAAGYTVGRFGFDGLAAVGTAGLSTCRFVQLAPGDTVQLCVGELLAGAAYPIAGFTLSVQGG